MDTIKVTVDPSKPIPENYIVIDGVRYQLLSIEGNVITVVGVHVSQKVEISIRKPEETPKSH